MTSKIRLVAMKNNTAPDPDFQVGLNENPPATPHQAYVAGLAAARCGEDFSTVVHWALLKWPLDGLPELASLGYWTDDGRDES